jgi:hypothetical protein
MNFILADVVTWTDNESHGLKLNPTKTQTVIFATQNTHARIDSPTLTPLAHNEIQLEFTDIVQNLGVFFGKNLVLDRQIIVCQKVYGTLNSFQ